MTRRGGSNGKSNSRKSTAGNSDTTGGLVLAEPALTDKLPFAIDESRFDFLKRFQALKPELNSYVLICGIRSRIGDVSVNILPESEIIDLPTDTGFFKRFFGKGHALNDFLELQGMASRADARAISSAATTAIQLGNAIYHRDSLDYEKSHLINLLRSITIMLARLMAKFSSKSEAFLHLERSRLRKDYRHRKQYKAVLTLAIEFDRCITKLTKLDELKDLQDSRNLIEQLLANIQMYHVLLVRICTELELAIGDSSYPDHPQIQDALLDTAFVTHLQLEKERAQTALMEETLQGAMEVLDYAAAFDEKLAGKNNTDR